MFLHVALIDGTVKALLLDRVARFTHAMPQIASAKCWKVNEKGSRI
jgi:hypothetical protein